MPFGLKKVGAMYQRLVNRMFGEMFEKTIEVYIDDMLVKSLKENDHVAHTKEMSNSSKNRMMLNSSKCIFGVLSKNSLFSSN